MIAGLKNNSYFRDDVNSVTIGSGSENMLNVEKTAVVQCTAHPKHSMLTMDYDVGVAKVATPFVVSDVRKPITLMKAGEEPAAHEPVVVSGWGTNSVSVYPSESVVNRDFACRDLYIYGEAFSLFCFYFSLIFSLNPMKVFDLNNAD